MQDLIVESLRSINITQLVAIGAIIWFFYNRHDRKIEKVEERLKEDTKKVEERLKADINKLSEKVEGLDRRLSEKVERLSEKVERLSEKVEDVDRRLCRIEGSLATHGHCLFNQAKPEQKAE